MSKFKRRSNPILILSDAPEAPTGLARVARDLAALASTMPEFRVAVLGRGGVGRRKFPWTSYSYPESGQWGEDYLAGVASDFFGGDHGIVLTNWDITRLGWLACPSTPDLRSVYGPGKNWDLWLYTPIDSEGVSGPLGVETQRILPGFDRVLAASEWGCRLIQNSGRPDCDWLPHLIDTRIFKRGEIFPRDLIMGWYPDDIIVGMVAANQSRKDYPVGFDCARLLRQEYGNRFKFWLHTDRMIGYWNVYALAADYGVQDCLIVTMGLSDAQLALRYSACDSTILPTGGEGFGFPIAESLACGVPCVTTDYAAGQELVSAGAKAAPIWWKIDTQYNVKRAVLNTFTFVHLAKDQIERKRSDPEGVGMECRERVEHLGMERLKYPWMRWLRDGLQ